MRRERPAGEETTVDHRIEAKPPAVSEGRAADTGQHLDLRVEELRHRHVPQLTRPRRIETEMVDVTQVANFEKKVPDEWITADGMHVNANFERYARPLIQAELTPIYINGVPRHIHLD